MSEIENTADELTEWLTREQHWKAIHAQLEKTRASLDDMFRLYMANAGEKPTSEMKRYYLSLVDQELEARTVMNDFIFARLD